MGSPPNNHQRICEGENIMGYTTEFEGVLEFTSPLTAEQELFMGTFLGELSSDVPEVVPYEKYRGYIQFDIAPDKSGIQWDGNEKFYDAELAAQTVILTMQKYFPDFGLEGELLAQGEEIGDIWKLAIVDGKAVRIDIKLDGHVKCPECDHVFKVTGNEYDN